MNRYDILSVKVYTRSRLFLIYYFLLFLSLSLLFLYLLILILFRLFASVFVCAFLGIDFGRYRDDKDISSLQIVIGCLRSVISVTREISALAAQVQARQRAIEEEKEREQEREKEKQIEGLADSQQEEEEEEGRKKKKEEKDQHDLNNDKNKNENENASNDSAAAPPLPVAPILAKARVANTLQTNIVYDPEVFLNPLHVLARQPLGTQPKR